MDALAARMSRDADEARATAAAVAAERTLLANDRLAVAVERVALEKKEAEVSVREEEARVFKGALKADADRQLQVRCACFNLRERFTGGWAEIDGQFCCEGIGDGCHL